LSRFGGYERDATGLDYAQQRYYSSTLGRFISPDPYYERRSKNRPHHVRGAWHLYGHSHGNLPDDPLALSMDVGVDSHDFRPWHFDEIQAVMKGKADARQHGHRDQSERAEVRKTMADHRSPATVKLGKSSPATVKLGKRSWVGYGNTKTS
jgi:RHS repeat-associated protein